MMRRVLLPLSLLCVAAVFAGLAFTTPIPSPPVPRICHSQLPESGLAFNAAVCRQVAADNDYSLGSYTTSLERYQLPGEISETFLVLAFIAFVGLVRWRIPTVFQRKYELPKAIEAIVLTVMVVGLVIFALSATLDVANFNPQTPDVLNLQLGYVPCSACYPGLYYPTADLANMIGLHSIVTDWLPASSVQGYGHFGVVAFMGFTAAILGFMVLRIRRGIANSAKEGMLLAMSLIFLLELGIVTLDRYLMVMQVANFASVRVENVPLLSNWFVLFVSSGLLILFLARGRHGPA